MLEFAKLGLGCAPGVVIRPVHRRKLNLLGLACWRILAMALRPTFPHSAVRLVPAVKGSE